MSTVRLKKLIAGTVVGGSATIYGATQIKAECVDRGEITHVLTDKNNKGHFINRNRLYLQHRAEPGTTSLFDIMAEQEKPYAIDISDDALIENTQQLCKEGKIVEVTFDEYLLPNLFKTTSRCTLKNIKEVNQEDEKTEQKFRSKC